MENELFRDPAPWFVPTKFDHDPRRIAPMRAATGLVCQTYSLAH